MSSAASQARCPRVPTGPGLGCEWAGCRARREKCWVPEGDMRPELQVAVRCNLGRLLLFFYFHSAKFKNLSEALLP